MVWQAGEVILGLLPGMIRATIVKMKTMIITTLACLSLLGTQVGLCDEGLVNEILPSVEESAWQKIDWMTDLWEARQEAARTGKPIYLWEMDGHPLGCV